MDDSKTCCSEVQLNLLPRKPKLHLDLEPSTVPLEGENGPLPVLLEEKPAPHPRPRAATSVASPSGSLWQRV